MSQNILKFHETYIPILKVLNECGEMQRNELRLAVKEKFYSDLPQDFLARKTKSGDPLVLNRIGWGMAYLKQGKLIEQPDRGMFKITEKGKAILEKGEFSHEDLKSDPDYIEYQKQKEEAQKESDELISAENATPQDMIDRGVNQIEQEVKTELLQRLKETNPYYFEKVVLELLKAMGYGGYQETSKSGDGGIDGIIRRDRLGLENIYVQAKRYAENKVRETDIRNFIGAMSSDTNMGVFVTTSKFDEKAKQKAKDAHHKIIFIDGEYLVELMYEFGVGVQLKDKYFVKELDEDFFIE